MNILIKNGTIITSSDIFDGDIYIKGEKIDGLGESINLPADEVIDAKGKYVIPGGIDVHTHFQLPVKGTVSADGFESGSRAAACGGVTTFIDFAHQVPGESPMKALDERIEEAKNDVYIDYGLHLGISDFNKNVLKEIPIYIERGVPSFKLYMIYAKEGWMSNDATIYAMLEAVREQGGLVIIHAENPYIIDMFTDRMIDEGKLDVKWHPVSRPNFVEAEAIKRALYLTEVTGSRIYIVHTSTAEGVALVAEAKGRGVMALAETCPQYLVLNDDTYLRDDGYLFLTSPPLRKVKDQLALWKGLSMGAIQVVSTDTCTFTREQKEPGKDDFTKLPGGIAGIETLIPMVHSEGVLKGRISLNQWVDLISTNPAKLFGLHPAKGTLAPGSDADIVIFDPEKKVKLLPENLHYVVDYSPYDRMTVTGWPYITMSRGKTIYRDGEFMGEKGRGKFIPRYYAD
ncbi:MAG: dihydropyrimidinase [Candidatus Eremiobacteraeota bacterium]|nr:dihydropyrimidinase [Candidatus Eremiobacteraeota bacterium]